MKKVIVSISVFAAYLTMMGFAEEISKLFGLPGTTSYEHLIIPNLILLIGFYIYDIVVFIKNPKKEQSLEDNNRKYQIYKKGWVSYQAMILFWLFLYSHTYTSQLESKGEFMGLGIGVMVLFVNVYKLYLYGFFKKI